jgi:hypothetical protein
MECPRYSAHEVAAERCIMEIRKQHKVWHSFPSGLVGAGVSTILLVGAVTVLCTPVQARELAFVTETKLSKFESNCKAMGGGWSSGSTSGGGRRGTCETETTVLSCSYDEGSTAAYCTGETTQPPSTPAKMVRPLTVKKQGKNALWDGGSGGVKSGGNGAVKSSGGGGGGGGIVVNVK